MNTEAAVATEAEVLDLGRTRPAVVRFHVGTGDRAEQKLIEALAEVEATYAGRADFRAVDVTTEAGQDLADAADVLSVCGAAVFVNGEAVGGWVGPRAARRVGDKLAEIFRSNE